MSSPTLFDDSFLEESATRVLVMWYPDWPVISTFPDIAPNEPLVVIEKGVVLACSASAREGGVRRGMRRREAQSRLPSLIWADYDPEADARSFEPLVRAIESISPGVELVRPGMCATGAQGPTRYFGSEAALVDAIGEYLESLGFPDAMFGIADGPFAAIQAAHVDRVIPPGRSPQFLAELPVDRLGDPELADILRRLGIRTMAEFAAIPANQVSARFGKAGAEAHRLARGVQRRRLAVRNPPPELHIVVDLDPPVDRVDVIAFTMRQHADRFVAGLARRDLVCTSLEVGLNDDGGATSRRLWRHPGWFSAGDVVDRVRWQVQAATPADRAVTFDSGGVLNGPITTVTLLPHEVDRIGQHSEQLDERARDDEKVHRAFSRVQSMLNHAAIVTPLRDGGRAPREFCSFAPWGESIAPRRDPLAPWPGRLPDPAPTQLLSPPESVLIHGSSGAIVAIDTRGFLTEAPRLMQRRNSMREVITSWAGPWHSDERWWDVAVGRELSRIQAVTDEHAYLLVRSTAGWWIEGIYD